MGTLEEPIDFLAVVVIEVALVVVVQVHKVDRWMFVELSALCIQVVLEEMEPISFML
jgi:hypothetical protein